MCTPLPLASPDVRAYLILTVGAFLLATNPVIARGVIDVMPPIGLAFWRWLLAAFMLLPFIATRLSTSLPTMLHSKKSLGLLGGLMIGSTTIILFALQTTTAINVSVVNATQPTLTVLFAWLFFRDRLTRLQTAGIASALVGVLIIVTRADWSLLLKLDFNIGDLLALGAMCGFALYALNIRKIPPELNAPEALFGIIVAGCALLLPFYLAETLFVQPVPLTGVSLAAILSLALLVSCLAMLTWNTGNRLIGPAKASIFMNLIPVFGTLLAMIFLGERLFLFHVIGGLMICLGIVLVVAKFSVRSNATS